MYLILNNKMYLNINNFGYYIDELKKINFDNTKLIIAPSYPLIPFFKEKNIIICSQDVSSKINGGFTGEVHASYLKGLGVKYSLVNHYERYTYFKEEYDDTISKINNLHLYGIIPILCITTSVQDKDIIIDKIKYICDKIDINKELIISYESEDALKTGIIDNYDNIRENIICIKKYFKDKYNKNIEVLYGGSVNQETIKNLIIINEIDGFIMGRESVEIDSIKKVLMEVENGRNK